VHGGHRPVEVDPEGDRRAVGDDQNVGQLLGDLLQTAVTQSLECLCRLLVQELRP
jgi:hypothetical protein